MIIPSLIFVFDCESIGLHGDCFAVGGLLVDEHGALIRQFKYATNPDECAGSHAARKWVKENIPALTITHDDPRDMREAFWIEFQAAKEQGAFIAADCAWPVEARFLAQCVDDKRKVREWKGPYPFHDIASILFALGHDPMATRERFETELPVHDPLADAKQSARLLVSTLRGTMKSP